MDLFAKIVLGYDPVLFFRKKLHPADSKPLLNYSKSQAADLFANYGPIGTFPKQIIMTNIFHKNATGVEFHSSSHCATFCFVL